MAENKTRFCMVAVPPAGEAKTKAALLNDVKWEAGTPITVRFMDGDPALQDRVKKVALGWTGPNMANVSLLFLAADDDREADIRIAFEQGNGSWSYLGTFCQQIALAKPTMNYGWLTPDSEDDELRRVVLHEFGHALGLIHEHQNPNKAISWNKAAVKRDLSGPPNNWTDAQIENNMFRKYDPDAMTSTPVDADSIMMYPIPASWTTDGFSADLNADLSSTDKEFIRQAYPW